MGLHHVVHSKVAGLSPTVLMAILVVTIILVLWLWWKKHDCQVALDAKTAPETFRLWGAAPGSPETFLSNPGKAKVAGSNVSQWELGSGHAGEGGPVGRTHDLYQGRVAAASGAVVEELAALAAMDNLTSQDVIENSGCRSPKRFLKSRAV